MEHGLRLAGAMATVATDAAGAPPFSLTEAARTEFQAAVQLLAERAAFLTAATGVAVAVRDGGSFAYCAAAGSDIPEPGAVLDSADESSRRCLEQAEVVRRSKSGLFHLLVPVVQDKSAAGLIELSSKYDFLDQDVNAVIRLADLVTVAVEHRAAAERAEAGDWETQEEALKPVAWHAPEKSEIEAAKENAAKVEPKAFAPEVYTCAACGFPVSPGRKLCVECEQKPGARVVPNELFSTQNDESWLSEHGYTIASIVVSAVAAAIIFWLRR